MVRLMINCPVTHRPVYTGLNMEDLKGDLDLKANYVIWSCLHCQQNHVWRLTDAFPESSAFAASNVLRSSSALKV